MIELKLWRSAIVLAEELNFRRAAERLSVSQPALTKQMQLLEARLGVLLFDRDGRTVMPTPAGRCAAAKARALLAQAQALELEVSGTQPNSHQRLVVGALEYITRTFLPKAIGTVQAQYPDATIEIVERTPTEVVGAILGGEVDVGLTLLPVHEPSLTVRAIVRGHWSIVVPATHPLATRDTVPVEDLAGERLIVFARRLNPDLYDRLVSRLTNSGKGGTIVYHAQDASVGPQLVANGIGLFVVASYAAPTWPAGLVIRRLRGFDGALSLGLAWKRASMRPVLRAFLAAAEHSASGNG
jgi:DNA-binding transcriptional LysR family regulator